MEIDMHKLAHEKFELEEKPFSKLLESYFEHQYKAPNKLFKNAPLNKPEHFYKDTFRYRPNNSFLWFKSGWMICYDHITALGSIALVPKVKTDFHHNFLMAATKDLTDRSEIINNTYEYAIRHADFVTDMNGNQRLFQKIKNVISEVKEINLYAYQILDIISHIISNMPLDEKIDNYDFTDNTYNTAPVYINDTYTYKSYGKTHDYKWTSFIGKGEYNSAGQFNMLQIIEDYNDIFTKYHDVIQIYKSMDA